MTPSESEPARRKGRSGGGRKRPTAIEDADERTRRLAINLIKRRMLSRREVTERLTARGVDDAAARERAIVYLESCGYVDDRALARAILHELTHAKAAGCVLVRQALERRGIAPAEIERVVAENRASRGGGGLEREARRRLLEAARGADSYSAAVLRRVAAGLVRRGFDAESVQDVIERIAGETR